MILTNQQFLKLIEHPVNKANIKSAKDLQDALKPHITKEGYVNLIRLYDGYESYQEQRIKTETAEPSTVEITNIIIGELNRWTNAQGTYKHYNFGDNRDKENKFISEVLSQVWRGKSIDEFVRNEFKTALDVEFNGFFSVVKPRIINTDNGNFQDREGIITPYKGNKYLSPYIIFTAIEDVIDVKIYGNKVEYIILKHGERTEEKNGTVTKTQYYRCIDDEKDLIIAFDGEKYFISEEYSQLKNELGFVPSIKVSNIKNDISNDEVRISQLSFLTPLLNKYLSKDAEHTLSDILHGHPQKWSIGAKCLTCDGTGEVDNDSDKPYFKSDVEEGRTIKCPFCGGAGSYVPSDTKTTIKIPQTDAEGKPYPLRPPAGYIEFSTEILNYQSEELQRLKNDIIYAGTNNKNIVADRFKTATETNTNTKTLEDKIDDRLRNIEEVETFLTDCIAKLHNDYRSSYKGCSIKYGRNLYYRNENDIILEIQNAKAGGLPMSYIKQLVIELYKTKYRNSERERERMLRLVELENYVGYTVNELVDMSIELSPEQLKYKTNFNDLVELYESKGKDITSDSINAVRIDLINLNKEIYGKEIGNRHGEEDNNPS